MFLICIVNVGGNCNYNKLVYLFWLINYINILYMVFCEMKYWSLCREICVINLILIWMLFGIWILVL